MPLPGSGRVSVLPLAIGVAVDAGLLVSVEDWTDALITSFALAIIVASVVVVAGYAGQLSLCQIALAGVGAWVAARLMSANGWPFELALLTAVVVTALLGVVVALPAVRTRGTSLAVATLALALMFNSLIFTNSAVTGGVRGLPVDGVSVLGLDLDPVDHPERYGGFVLVVLVLVGLVVANVRRGRVGARLLAVRSNERAAASLGIGVVGAKLYAFALAASIAALGGVLLSMRQANVGFGQYGVAGSMQLVQYAGVGGLPWISGVVSASGSPGALGTEIFSAVLPEGSDITSWLAVLSGVGAVTVLRQAPDGIASEWSRRVHRITEPFQLPRRSSGAPPPGRTRRRCSTSSPASPANRAARCASTVPPSTRGPWSGGRAPGSSGRGRRSS